MKVVWSARSGAVVCAIAFGVLSGGYSARAQTSTPRTTIPDSYAAAMKCFVANGHARLVKQRAGDAAGASRYEAGERASFEAARVLAATLNYSASRFDSDIDRYRERELPQMVNDPAYFRESVAICRALQLMPLP